MFVDARILTGLVATLAGAGVIIVAQKNEIERLKNESRDKSAAIGVYRRAYHALLSDTSPKKVEELLASLDEEAKFIEIIKNL